MKASIMIPASYVFRAGFRDRFEDIAPREADPAPKPAYRLPVRVSAAILFFVYGAAHPPLHLGTAVLHDRRR